MKCDELKEHWFEAYGIQAEADDRTILEKDVIKVYSKSEVDEAISELKAENEQLKESRQAWIARAGVAEENEVRMKRQLYYADESCRRKK